jgi:ABC-2 type transport system ATP-binding protein
MQGGAAVEVAGVTKWFGETTALDRVDLRVEPGSVHGLLGPNGAGKTTLLSVLFGLVVPDEGEVRLFGRTRRQAGAGWLDGVGGFIETPRFYPYLSGTRNLGVLAALDEDLVGDVIDLVGLEGAAAQKVKGYSLGMRQRLGLAASLLRRPRLLILDEPTNGMDPAGIRELRAAVRGLADRGVSVVLSSHDMAQVEEVCDRVTVLHRGEVAFDGTLDRMRAAAPDPAWCLRTSDDRAALDMARGGGELEATARAGGGLTVVAEQSALDGFVIDLALSGLAVRGLALDVTPLESLFFALTQAKGREH